MKRKWLCLLLAAVLLFAAVPALGEEEAEEQEKVRLFAVEAEDPAPQRRDMCVYDEAYEAIERLDVDAALAAAERYFRGEATAEPVWEILSDKPARAVRDLTHLLRPAP